MTLQELFDKLAGNPVPVVVFFILLPIAAAIAGKIASNDEVRQSPWNYFYATLVYLTCVPGIFAVTLSIYFFLFERRSILDTNLYTQEIGRAHV